MQRPDPSEVMAVVARRGDVLRALADDGGRKCELDDELDVSRSTIDRAIRELEGLGLVERAEDGYFRTLSGTLALEEYDRFKSRMDGVLEARDVLSPLPSDADVDAAVVDGAEVVLADRHSPLRPARHQVEIVERASHVRAAASAVLPQHVDAYYQGIVERGMHAEIILSTPVMERVVADHDTKFHDSLTTGRVDLRQLDRDLSYSLMVASTPDGPVMGMLVYVQGGIRGFVGNDSQEAVSWARARLDDYWSQASPIPIPVEE
ncbi:helix-turn-helix transcriptional regulator [Salinirubrum litoreum]|uniref:Helix-turn-helix transcriptional regulator n=1 Tax=Salinirubrum litoreum TaxID=1126234 RepID=A0ABD5RA01_9EURY|nr:GntR family transcriptional regulator [Salinirubrum litoreum]